MQRAPRVVRHDHRVLPLSPRQHRVPVGLALLVKQVVAWRADELHVGQFIRMVANQFECRIDRARAAEDDRAHSLTLRVVPVPNHVSALGGIEVRRRA